MDRFTVLRDAVLRDPSMLAQGLGGNITGARADLIICDDVEVAGNCDTPGKREELRARLAECEFVLVPDGTILFVGTPHCAETLYLPATDPAAFLRGYRRLVLPLLDTAGRSAWPERFTPAAIEALRSRVGPLHFTRQMLLQPVAEAALRLDPALLIRYAAEPEYRERGDGLSFRCSAVGCTRAAASGIRPMGGPRGKASAAMPRCWRRPMRTGRATTTCTGWPT
jgi:hypothetical protein